MKQLFSLFLILAAFSSSLAAAQLTLRWSDNSSNENGFTVERASASAGPFVAVANLPANSTSYVDTTLAPGTRYWFRVCAYNDAGKSAYSNTPNAMTLGDVPGAPGGADLTPPAVYTPPEIVLTLSPGNSVTVIAAADTTPPPPSP